VDLDLAPLLPLRLCRPLLPPALHGRLLLQPGPQGVALRGPHGAAWALTQQEPRL
jgi:hypothetical protein